MYVVMALILFFHIVLCFLTIFFTVLKLTHLRYTMFPFMILVPLFGPICAILLELHKRRNGKIADIELHKFRLEAEIYRSLGFEVEEDKDVVSLEEAMILNNSTQRRSLMMDLVRENVVPLEEALAISSTDVRRKLMMDILNNDTVAFYDLLEQARLNDDVEVVHYATTAMVELNKRYDLMLEKYATQHKEYPKDCSVLNDYCDCLKRFLNLGMIRGQMVILRRSEYIELLKELILLEPLLDHYCDLVTQQMLNEDYNAARATLREMVDRWPGEEKVWLLQIEYHARRGDGDAVKRMVNTVLREHVYLSAKAREQLAFWSGKAEV